MKYFLPLFLLFVLSSCSIQKRLYNKGFYISKNQPTKKYEVQDTTKQVSLLHTIKQIKEETNNSPLLALVTNAIEAINKKQTYYSAPNAKQSSLIDPCDTIVMKTGERILGKITKALTYHTHFKNCDSQDDYTSSLDNRDISFIHYAKGNIEASEFENNNRKEKINGLAIAGFILSVLAVLSSILFFVSALAGNDVAYFLSFVAMFIFFLLAFILSLISVLKTALSTEKPKRGSILGIIGLLLCIAVIGIIIALFSYK